MGFIRGLIAGVAVSAAAAAWYLSRSGQQARDQLQLERKLGEIGDEFDRRARDMQAQVSAQIADIQKRNGNGVAMPKTRSTPRPPPPPRPRRRSRPMPRTSSTTSSPRSPTPPDPRTRAQDGPVFGAGPSALRPTLPLATMWHGSLGSTG